jgi:hypothetical protein
MELFNAPLVLITFVHFKLALNFVMEKESAIMVNVFAYQDMIHHRTVNIMVHVILNALRINAMGQLLMIVKKKKFTFFNLLFLIFRYTL